jgi:methylmalonyl-CoA decarboxylase
MPFIKIERLDTIAIIRLAHYERRNALGGELVTEILAALAQFGAEDVRAVILRNDVKDKTWSAGFDINELPSPGQDPVPYDNPLRRLGRAGRECRAPVIAMLDGAVWGGACELMMACDIVTGDENAAFAISPARLGLPYNASGIQGFLARLPLNIVNEMFFTAEPIGAGRAAALGLLNLLAPAAELEEKTYAMARLIASRSPLAISAYKAQAQSLAQAAPLPPSEAERLEAIRRDAYCGADYAEGLRAFAERRAPQFPPRG